MGKKRFEEIEAHQLDAFRIFAIEGESDRLLEVKTVAGIEYYSVTPELLKSWPQSSGSSRKRRLHQTPKSKWLKSALIETLSVHVRVALICCSMDAKGNRCAVAQFSLREAWRNC